MNKKNFTQPLIAWYQDNKRDLVFRKSQDPYHIWISEIMAQQTQIVTMLDYYQRWIEKWPTIDDLALADEQEVLKAWEGLGYYSRARNILETARIVKQNYHSKLPTSFLELNELPGIGEYTAGAIASIAYKQNIAAIDGNVIRVMSRLKKDSRDFLKNKNKKELKETLESLMISSDPSDFTQALMELGALVCKPANPQCLECPLQTICLSKKDNSQLNYPVKRTKIQNQIIEYNVFVYKTSTSLLVSSDDNDNLMKGLLRLPMLEVGIEIPFRDFDYVYTMKHLFSHKTWILNIYVVNTLTSIFSDWYFIPIDDINKHSWTGAHKKILKKLF